MKIYLAKSNKTTPFRVNLVRQCLSNLGVEVLEHDPKKTYSDTTLLRADYLMILPESPDPYMAVIGKGLASQINTWKHHKGGKNNILIMSSVEITDLRACGLDDVEITNSRDWTNYAQMYGEVYEEDSLANSIKRLQSKEETDNISATSKMYGQSLGSFIGFTGKVYSRRILIA